MILTHMILTLRRLILIAGLMTLMAGPALAGEVKVAVAANFTEPARELSAGFQGVPSKTTALNLSCPRGASLHRPSTAVGHAK